MTGSRSLHDSAVRLIPKHQGQKPATYWVAVLKLHTVLSGDYVESDFLWVRCRGKTTTETIRIQYEKNCLPDKSWVLEYESKVVSLEATIADLNKHGDQVVVFRAAKSTDNSQLNDRQPLQPSNNQVLSPLGSDLESPRNIEKIRPSLGDPDGQPSTAQDENSRPQQTVRPKQAYAAVAQQISAPGLGPHANHYKQTSSPMNSHCSISASRTSPQLPSHGYRVTSSPATQAYYPATPVSMPYQSQSTPNQSNLMSITRSSSPTSPSDVEATQNGFNSFCHNSRARLRILYPNGTEEQLTGDLATSWRLLSYSERNSWITQAKVSQIKNEIKIEPKPTPSMPVSPAVEEPSITADELEEQKQQTFQLQTLFKHASPEMLEASVEQGVKLLERLRAPLVEKMQNSPEAEQWIEQIDNLRKQAVKTKTIIGVVGNTGAGKSSVINAMLEEERLVPTNCMRACTAVVTEISYNYEENPYRAQIEFISTADWEKELKVLFQDLFDGNGQVSRECANEDTDAGIAYAKIRAVYPRKTKEDIANSSIETMLREVSHVLGTSRDIRETESLQFYSKLQKFVDSKEKSTGRKDKDKKKERKEMEFWPLIRVVRVYVKSPALATGAVIVDLPGVHDANAARAAVAEGYMKQCTGLWIVAPINRAVDDKAAKSLLGESFKRQLKMDGGFNSVTFICSKTDDISLGEAQDSLGLDDEMAPSWAEIDELSKRQMLMKKELEGMRDSKVVYGEVMNDVDEQIEIWDALKEKIEEGEQVFPPKPKGAQKRKTSSKEKPQKKIRRTLSSDDEEDVEYSDSEDENSEDEDEHHEASSQVQAQEQEPLTEELVATKLHELRTTKKEARRQKIQITEKITKMRKMIEEANKAEQEITSKMSALCISGRNEYSKAAIQQDFAAGIRELDQELAAEENEESFNPDVEIRDYDEVARGLPVFCVSSRGFQKLKGRLRKDPPISGFTTVEETGIPQLQAHCEKLTETGRSGNCKAFNNKLSQLLNSLTLWASSDGTGANMTAEQKAREASYLRKGLKTLERDLENAVKTACKELSDELTDNIFDKYDTAIKSATETAIATAFHWGSPVNREDRAAGGLCWATYKAICRRNGIYTNSQGPHEWNIALAEPMMKVIASGWEKVFTRRSPMVMATFARHAASALKTFHHDIDARARRIGAGIASLSMLQQQLSVYETVLKDLSTMAKDMINTHQKEINREFTPVIERAMQTAYQECVDERGPGSYARMKAAMNGHVLQERQKMFQESADNVRRMLDSMVKEVGAMMDEKADEVFLQIKRDYRAVLGGRDVQQNGEILPKTQRLVRKEIMRIIDDMEKVSMRVAGLMAEENKDDQDGEGGESVGDSEGGNENEEGAGEIK
ncbi:hypothetical protein N7G274_000348 [Stereocaulon virgatum]|uniref:Uncharacterized protein n=1 Tax=Stereocaulon virgatum TaxID=373712 RepID=A0ABR4AUM1_9LECA